MMSIPRVADSAGPFVLSGKTLNDLAAGSDMRLPFTAVKGQPLESATDWLLVRNDTGEDQSFGSVVEISDVLIHDGDKTAGVVFQSAAKGIKPDRRVHRPAIYLDSVKSGCMGRAMISGVGMAKVNVSNPEHRFATTIYDSTELASSWCGTIQLVTKATASGVQRVIVQMLNAPIWEIGKANGEIAAAAGDVFGTGQANLWYLHRDTNTMAVSSPLITVDVLNPDTTAIATADHVLLQPYQHTGQFLAFPIRCS